LWRSCRRRSRRYRPTVGVLFLVDRCRFVVFRFDFIGRLFLIVILFRPVIFIAATYKKNNNKKKKKTRSVGQYVNSIAYYSD
jgi:hypothetical protein